MKRNSESEVSVGGEIKFPKTKEEKEEREEERSNEKEVVDNGHIDVQINNEDENEKDQDQKEEADKDEVDDDENESGAEDEEAEEEEDESDSGSDGDGGVRKSWRKAKPGEDEEEPKIIYCVTNTAPQYGIPANIRLYTTLYSALSAKHAFIAKWANECAGCMVLDPPFSFDKWSYSGYFGDDDYISSDISRIDMSTAQKGKPFFEFDIPER